MKPISQQSEQELQKLFLIAAQDLVASLTCFGVILKRVGEIPDIKRRDTHNAIKDIGTKVNDAMLDLTAALKANIGPLNMKADNMPETPDELLAKRLGKAASN